MDICMDVHSILYSQVRILHFCIFIFFNYSFFNLYLICIFLLKTNLLFCETNKGHLILSYLSMQYSRGFWKKAHSHTHTHYFQRLQAVLRCHWLIDVSADSQCADSWHRWDVWLLWRYDTSRRKGLKELWQERDSTLCPTVHHPWLSQLKCTFPKPPPFSCLEQPLHPRPWSELRRHLGAEASFFHRTMARCWPQWWSVPTEDAHVPARPPRHTHTHTRDQTFVGNCF